VNSGPQLGVAGGLLGLAQNLVGPLGGLLDDSQTVLGGLQALLRGPQIFPGVGEGGEKALVGSDPLPAERLQALQLLAGAAREGVSRAEVVLRLVPQDPDAPV
jgi:hypothetical protein